MISSLYIVPYYTIAEDKRELQLLVSFGFVTLNYTIAEDKRELQLPLKKQLILIQQQPIPEQLLNR